MCGICCIVKLNNKRPNEELLHKMVASMQHRGPDGCGIHIEDNIGLGHTRLAILDLSERGSQPMNYMGRYTITYNGEVYNYIELRKQLLVMGYTFTSDTDVEVVLAAYDAWGAECLSRFNGMWAFALYDNKEKRLFISRDHFGIKPLYYTIVDGDILIASEIKTILQDSRVSRKLNRDLAVDFLTQSLLDHTNDTFFVGIQKLPPGSFAYIKQAKMGSPVSYYRPEFTDELIGELKDEQIERFAELFYDSVRLRLRADVATGSCLSGGLDSSSIVCGIKRIAREDGVDVALHTFSVCPEDARISERKYMDDVLAYTGTIGHFITPQFDELLDDMRKVVYCQEEPVGSASIYAGYRVMKLAKENGISVLLDGQGADEILCGYRKSRLYYVKRLAKSGKYCRAILELLQSASQTRTSFNKSLDILKAKRILGIGNNGIGEKPHSYLRSDMLGYGYDYDRSLDFQYNDVMTVSLPVLLRYADKNSMAHSIESRLPFLDFRLVDFTASLPLNAKIRHGYSKYIMRQALDMPKTIRERKDKIGFVMPDQLWMRQGKEQLKAMFSQSTDYIGSIVDTNKVLTDWEKLEKDEPALLWRLIMQALWMSEYHVN